MLIIIIIISAGGYCLGFRLSRRPHWSPEVPGSTAFCLAQGQGFKLNRSCTPLLATRTHKAQSSHFGSKVQAILAQAKRPPPTAVYGSFSTNACKKKGFRSPNEFNLHKKGANREPNGTKREPKGNQGGAEREPERARKEPEGATREPKGSKKGAKRERQWNQQESNGAITGSPQAAKVHDGKASRWGHPSSNSVY